MGDEKFPKKKPLKQRLFRAQALDGRQDRLG
jgi:hypothetical protein